ncbi:hypothetical protein [Candidatus Poriferisodalis sp.]|uniref:hypothetical protein n=1 Tax=Candidatus Poriferisodalis sp. TaxID=3101277 RepID=UPI003B0155B4
MARVVHLPDDVAAAVAAQADERGITVDEFVCELVERASRRRALEAFIGGADVPLREMFDIRRAREQLADELLGEHQAISDDFARLQAQPSDYSLDLD